LGPEKKEILFQILAEKKSGSHVLCRRKCPSLNLAPFIPSSKNCPAGLMPRAAFLSASDLFLMRLKRTSPLAIWQLSLISEMFQSMTGAAKRKKIPPQFVSEQVADDSFLDTRRAGRINTSFGNGGIKANKFNECTR
jgi:hypothetical protein